MVGGRGGFISIEQQKHRSICAVNKLHEKRKNDPKFDGLYRSILRETTTKCIKEGKIKTWKKNYSWKGKNHTELTKERISKSCKNLQIGEKNSQFGTSWITNGIENKKVKKESLIPIGWKNGRIITNGAVT